MSSDFYFLKSTVYHSRRETKENSFRYPVLNFFCPVDRFDEFGQILKIKFFKMVSVESRSYLGRAPVDLNAEIQNFIQKNFQLQFDAIILQSMPKMLGYVFNPISFWYCYNAKSLQGVLCEVNNTFGEKHYYWLYQQGRDLKERWIDAEKQFHVSPFFKIEGKYRFRFTQNENKIFSEIDYLDLNGKLKLKTWINGQLFPLSEFTLKSILFEYGWMTPLVVFRIHFQAAKLFLKKVRFVSKPVQALKDINHESAFFRD